MMHWPSQVPDHCPFEPSPLLRRVTFTGRFGDYHCGDTIFPTWGDDGLLYTPWTDGTTDGVRCSSGGDLVNGFKTGHAVMRGDDPLSLVIENTSPPKQALAVPYRGRYPCGSLMHDGVWYYGTYCLGPEAEYQHGGYRWNWPNIGPMPGFHISHDRGKTWTPPPGTPSDPLFPEPSRYLGALKMGSPQFVDFGKNMEHSPDGKAYLLAMGAVDDDSQPRPCVTLRDDGGFDTHVCAGPPMNLQLRKGEAEGDYADVFRQAFAEVNGRPFAHGNLSWVSADQVYLARVTPTPETINDLGAYEFFAGRDQAGRPIWSSDFAAIQPLLEWNNHMGRVSATWVPGLGGSGRYLMCVTDGWPTAAWMHSYFLEAETLTGPWRMVSYLKRFGEQAYFLNFPSKFISPDGHTFWLCYSANFGREYDQHGLTLNPPGGRYGLSLIEVKLG